MFEMELRRARSCRLSRQVVGKVESEAQQLPVEEPEKTKNKEEKVESEAQQLPVEEPEKTKNKEEKAQQESNTSKVAKQKNLKKGGEEKPEDYVDPETPLGEKKRLSRQMAKQFNRSSVENS